MIHSAKFFNSNRFFNSDRLNQKNLIFGRKTKLDALQTYYLAFVKKKKEKEREYHFFHSFLIYFTLFVWHMSQIAKISCIQRMSAWNDEGQGINVFDMARQKNEKDANSGGEVALRLEDRKKTRKRMFVANW